MQQSLCFELPKCCLSIGPIDGCDNKCGPALALHERRRSRSVLPGVLPIIQHPSQEISTAWLRACRKLAFLAVASGVVCSLFPREARAEEQLSIGQALSEARTANARLPVAATDVAIAREAVREAEARRWLQISIEGGVRYAPPMSYGVDVNSENLQAVLTQPLYAGGAIDSRIRASEEFLFSRAARYRAAEKDVELAVRTDFAQFAQLGASLAVRREGLARLDGYVTYLEQLHAAGRPVTYDLLKTRARQLSERGNVRGLERRLAEISLDLNDLLGRAPDRTLSIAPLAGPQPPPTEAQSSSPRPWQRTPEVREAVSDVRAAAANVEVARAARRPSVNATLDAGLLGSGVPGAPSWARPADRLRNDAGVSAAVSLSWLVFDLGIVSSQIAQARLTRDQSAQSLVVAQRHARLEWTRARTVVAAAYDELQTRAQAVPIAHDAYLEAESIFRGGQGTVLDVLDSYSNWVAASDAYESTLFDYRSALAQLERWGLK
ncbi:MAG: TolC family protein [Polyangiaceae bacterium]